MSAVEIPHTRWPMSIEDGRLAVVEQDTLTEVVQCVNVLLHTQRGDRVLLPDFGIDDPTFADGIDVDQVIDQAATYEDRAHVEWVDTVADDPSQITTRLEVDLA